MSLKIRIKNFSSQLLFLHKCKLVNSRGLSIYLLVVFCKKGALSARYIVFIAHTFILDLNEGLQIKRCLVSKVLSYKSGEVFKSYEIQ